MFHNNFKNKKVLVTGITGFKGSWLLIWLEKLGAEICGFGLEPDTNPNHYELIGGNNSTQIGDLNDLTKLEKLIEGFQPEIVFHLAAQSLVRKSYREPVSTYMTNVIGTLNVLEACRKKGNPKAIIIVTSDKVYENKEWDRPYTENDVLGGYDIYSSSKACAEILTSSYLRSFYHPNEYGIKHQTLISTVRAGNVIGGGDWCEDRLIPDIIRATVKNEGVSIRNPDSVRPWQHVLDPLSGYLLLAEKLLLGQKELAGAWNFGPDSASFKTVFELQMKMNQYWSQIKKPEISNNKDKLHEAGLLSVDSTKARNLLNWKPVWNFEKATEKTCIWYKEFVVSNKVISSEQLSEYIYDANEIGIIWKE